MAGLPRGECGVGSTAENAEGAEIDPEMKGLCDPQRR